MLPQDTSAVAAAMLVLVAVQKWRQCLVKSKTAVCVLIEVSPVVHP